MNTPASAPSALRRDFLVRCLALIPVPAGVSVLPAAAQPAATSPAGSTSRVAIAAGQLPIALERVRVDAAITGRAAKTRVELVLRNDNASVLEGELLMPLVEGQSVTGFALDIDGEMRPAVPVEKAKGRQVFEDISRVRVDPALLESTAAQNYRLRVYPLPPQGIRRVAIEISEWLEPAADDRFAWRLPLRFEQPIGELEVDVSVQGVQADSIDASLDADSLRISAEPGSAARLSLRRTNHKGAGSLVLALPGRLPDSGVTSTETWRGRDYFYAEVPLPVQVLPRPRPQRVALLWDASGSGAQRFQDREFALLDAAFRSWGSTQVDLLVVRDVALPVARFDIADGNWDLLRRRLEEEAFDGATRLDAMAVPEGADLALLFSDGQGTYGAGGLPAATLPVYAFGSAPGADAARLRLVAESSGGRYVNLGLASVEQALQMLLERPARVAAVRAVGAEQVVTASMVPEHGRIAMAGRLLAPQVQLSLEIVGADGRRRTLPVLVGSRAAPQAHSCVAVAAQRWAAMRLASLEADPERHRAAIQRIGREFGLVTSETSLIVLDSVADYVRHEIEPPSALLAAWRAQMALQALRAQADLSSYLNRVAARHAERVLWWRHSFPKDDPAERRERERRREAQVVEAARARWAEDLRRAREELAAARARAAASVGPEETKRAERAVELATKRVEEAVARQHAEASRMGMEETHAAAEAARRVRERQAASASRAKELPREAGFVAVGPAPGPHPAPVQGAQASIRLVPWVPDSPAMRRLRAARDAERYAVYLDERPSHAHSTAFFIDVAELFLERGQTALGLRVLSNLAELQLGNRHILRILAYRLLQAGQVEAAVPLLEQVARLAPDEPQSLRDLGLAHAAAGRHQRAVDLLWEVVSRPWDRRFADVDMTALAELNAIVACAQESGSPPPDTRAVDARLLLNLPLALRVVLTWDSDNTDIDLHVIDPNGERCYYGRRLTYQGGRMSADFTSGYGPEEFALRDAKPGTYTILADFFGHTQQIVSGYTTLMVKFTTGFGTSRQQDRDIVVRLSGRRQMLTLGTVQVDATPRPG